VDSFSHETLLSVKYKDLLGKGAEAEVYLGETVDGRGLSLAHNAHNVHFFKPHLSCFKPSLRV
jgi:hypothetical protein